MFNYCFLNFCFQLTLARYVLELSLMEYQFVGVSPSKLAAAALLWSLLHFKQNWVRKTITINLYENRGLIREPQN